MKKIYLLILAVAVSLTFCACGEDNMITTGDTAKAPATDKVTDKVTDKITDRITEYVTEEITKADKESDTVNDGEGGGLPEIVTDAVSDVRGFFGRLGNK